MRMGMSFVAWQSSHLRFALETLGTVSQRSILLTTNACEISVHITGMKNARAAVLSWVFCHCWKLAFVRVGCFHANSLQNRLLWFGYFAVLPKTCIKTSSNAKGRQPRCSARLTAQGFFLLSPVFFLPSLFRQCSSLGSMFLSLISHLSVLFLTDLGQNKLGVLESINRTYRLGSLSAVWWKSHCNWIFRFDSEVSVKFLHKNHWSVRAGNIYNNL